MVVPGMIVRSADGELLGWVVACHSEGFVIEEGPFFPTDYFVSFEDVMDFRGNVIYLDLDLESLLALGRSRGEEWGVSLTGPLGP